MKLIFSQKYKSILIMECDICCDILNKRERKPIECPSCNEICCMTCFTRILLDNDFPKCTFCDKGYTHTFIAGQTTQSFYEKTYMKHRAMLELSREKSLLPETQSELHIFLEKRSKKRKLTELRHRYSEHVENMKILYKNEELNQWKKEKKLSEEIRQEIKQMERNDPTEDISSSKTPMFNKPCPMEKCRGFICDTHECGTCKTRLCAKCMEVTNKSHVCDSNILKNIEAMKKECKPCPGCSKPIYKINGCDLMWCVSCHSQFSWERGCIVKGINHNPHYYIWMRENKKDIPRNPNDMCQLPWIYDIHEILQQKGKIFPFLENCHRLVGHIMTKNINQPPDTRKNDRFLYLLGELDDESWVKKLTISIKQSEKREEYNQLVELTSNVIRDIFINYTRCITEDLEEEMHTFRRYINMKFIGIKQRYKCKVLMIDKKWDILIV